MSCDLNGFEECFFTNPFSPLSDYTSSNDILKAFQQTNYTLAPLSTHNILDSQFAGIDQNGPTISSSPPCHQLETMSIYQMGNLVNPLDLCPPEIKTEESQSQLPFYDYSINISSFLPQSYGECDNSVKMMQRSFIESSNVQSLSLSSPDHGDLHSMETKQTLAPSPLDANLKVDRYSPEERKQRILRYKAKRRQRNFNKTIKYACRKTLADNRPRIRGRFVRNDELEQAPEGFTFQRFDEELWSQRNSQMIRNRSPHYAIGTTTEANFESMSPWVRIDDAILAGVDRNQMTSNYPLSLDVDETVSNVFSSLSISSLDNYRCRSLLPSSLEGDFSGVTGIGSSIGICDGSVRPFRSDTGLNAGNRRHRRTNYYSSVGQTSPLPVDPHHHHRPLWRNREAPLRSSVFDQYFDFDQSSDDLLLKERLYGTQHLFDPYLICSPKSHDDEASFVNDDVKLSNHQIVSLLSSAKPADPDFVP